MRGIHPYNMSVFRENTENILPFGGGNYYRYSDLVSMAILFGDCVFFLILTWYFDHVITSNRGRGESPFFPIKRLIRCFVKDKSGSHEGYEVASPEHGAFAFQDEEESATWEREKVYNNSRKGQKVTGLRIKNINKTFKGLCSRKGVQALKNFTLEIGSNELMGVLGHNGAGKTTNQTHPTH